MKYALWMLLLLAVVWMLWSGHTEPFMLLLGTVSCLVVLVFCGRMGILDSEGVPLQIGLRPLIFAPWLVKEVLKANLDVTRRVLSTPVRIDPAMTEVQATQQTEIGRVVFANCITLTPGTVSVDVHGKTIQVHWLASPPEGVESLREMDRRVGRLEGGG